jgi:hypothetical protein
MHHPFYECANVLLCIWNLLSIFARDYSNHYGFGAHSADKWIIIMFIFNFCFLAEWTFQIVIYGVWYCVRRKVFMKLELIL